MNKQATEKELARLERGDAWDLKIAKVVSCKVRYFKDEAVLGSKEFVNSFFESQRKRFGPKRKDGARRPRGSLKGLAGEIWSLRDLKDG
ncbi:MAG: putative transposase [Paracoccaceae bacterium]|jgi:putative transposase